MCSRAGVVCVGVVGVCVCVCWVCVCGRGVWGVGGAHAHESTCDVPECACVRACVRACLLACLPACLPVIYKIKTSVLFRAVMVQLEHYP